MKTRIENKTVPVLEVLDVAKQFDDIEALSHVNLSLTSGKILALLGPSGCGKTTLLRCIAGLERPSEGRILIAGEEVSGPQCFLPPESRRLGMVFQDYALWPHMTVAENVCFPLTMQSVAKSDRQNKVDWALKTVGLQDFATRAPSSLSGGQQQRVALARAIVSQPRLLLMDEPLSNLDKGLRESLAIEIRHLIKTLNLTAIFVTHDQNEAYSLADEVAVLHKGAIQQIAPPEVLYRQPATPVLANFLDAGTIVQATQTAQGLTVDPLLEPLPLESLPLLSGPIQIMFPRSSLTFSKHTTPYPYEMLTSIYHGEFYSVKVRVGAQLELNMLTPFPPAAKGYVDMDVMQLKAWDMSHRKIHLRLCQINHLVTP